MEHNSNKFYGNFGTVADMIHVGLEYNLDPIVLVS